jgi:hypothetical protein
MEPLVVVDDKEHEVTITAPAKGSLGLDIPFE